MTSQSPPAGNADPATAESRRFRKLISATVAVMVVPAVVAVALKQAGIATMPWRELLMWAAIPAVFAPTAVLLVTGLPNVARRFGLIATLDGDDREKKIFNTAWRFQGLVTEVMLIPASMLEIYIHPGATFSVAFTVLLISNFVHVGALVYLSRTR